MNETIVTEVAQPSINLEYLESLSETSNEMLSEIAPHLEDISIRIIENTHALQSIYACLLFVVGTISAIGVCVLLYKFIKLFY